MNAPTEPGFYFATFDCLGAGEARTMVEVVEEEGVLRARLPGDASLYSYRHFKDWGPKIEEPPKPVKPRAAIVSFSFDAVAQAMNFPEGVRIDAMQVDFFSQSLRCKLSGPGLSAAHELEGFEAEAIKEASMRTAIVQIDGGRPVQYFQAIGLGT